MYSVYFLPAVRPGAAAVQSVENIGADNNVPAGNYQAENISEFGIGGYRYEPA